MRMDYSEQDARRLLSGAPVVLVTARWRGKDNVMPVAWHMPLSNDPPLLGIAVHPSRHTYDMIRYSEEFAINIPSRRLMAHVHYLGSLSGREVDKLEMAKLPTTPARKVEAPLIAGCLGYIECGLEEALRLGDHVLFVGKVVAVQAEGAAFSDTWLLKDDDGKPLHYLGGESYAILGERLQVRLPATPEKGLEEALREAEEG